MVTGVFLVTANVVKRWRISYWCAAEIPFFIFNALVCAYDRKVRAKNLNIPPFPHREDTESPFLRKEQR
jgi:hypothetical protein